LIFFKKKNKFFSTFSFLSNSSRAFSLSKIVCINDLSFCFSCSFKAFLYSNSLWLNSSISLNWLILSSLSISFFCFSFIISSFHFSLNFYFSYSRKSFSSFCLLSICFLCQSSICNAFSCCCFLSLSSSSSFSSNIVLFLSYK